MSCIPHVLNWSISKYTLNFTLVHFTFSFSYQAHEEKARFQRLMAESELRLDAELTRAREIECEEEEVDAVRGKREMVALVGSEVRLITQHYEEACLRHVSPLFLPLFIVTVNWVSLPRVSISAVSLHQLSGLRTHWEQHQIPLCLVHTEHVLLNHRTLQDNTLPQIIFDDGSVSRLSSKGRFLPELSTPRRICALGNMIAACGIQVSGTSVVKGWVTITIAALAPFFVGWWFNIGNVSSCSCWVKKILVICE